MPDYALEQRATIFLFFTKWSSSAKLKQYRCDDAPLPFRRIEFAQPIPLSHAR
jgi:hypothetical protein